MDMLTIEGLKKSFGSRKVLKGVSLSVPEGAVYGFIGQNGAGKTTTMKLILGLLKKDSGEICVNGESVCYGETKTNRFIGYLPDVPEYYGYMSPREYLQLCGDITGMERNCLRQRTEELLGLVGLREHEKRRISGFSRGMKQRLGIAQALLHEPKLLICDEPTSALDPIGRKEILDILEQVKNRTTVLFSTHILSDVERICDRIAILHKGSIVQNGTLKEIRAKHRVDALSVEFSSPSDRTGLAKYIKQVMPGILVEETGRSAVLHTTDIDMAEQKLFAYLLENQVVVEQIQKQEPSLERLFMEAVQ